MDSSRDGVIGVRDPGGHNLPGVALFRTNQAHLKKDGDEHPDSLIVVNSRLQSVYRFGTERARFCGQSSCPWVSQPVAAYPSGCRAA